MNIEQRLQDLINNGYTFNMSEYINTGWDLLKRNFGGFIGFAIIYFVLAWMASLLPLANLVLNLGLSVLLLGIPIVAQRMYFNKEAGFNHFFDGFQKFMPLVLVSLLQGIILFALVIPAFAAFYFLGGDGIIQYFVDNWDIVSGGGSIRIDNDDFEALGIDAPSPLAFFSFFLLLFPVFYLSIAWAFAPYFVYFHDLSPWNALEASRKVITKKWFSFFGFMLVMAFFIIFGFVALCIGILVAFPAITCMTYAAFESIVGTEYPEEETDVIQHFG